ncbi:DUF7002 family protein [Paenibacillus thalictri]|uniref:DUF4433 domain-containing protein n=1 Tax=Paenibacillus thalictri TaxID=2527873 RepID=A0A4Q9DF51_9BACL|nr:hypothetical protein [Paenibacillus thalictri]TBL68563.1 hypothetical protein EYB31_37835 [Paenibacillus thalictri]
MKEHIAAEITKTKGRKSLYHFTRVQNLQAMAHFDALFSSNAINPGHAGERRLQATVVDYQQYAMTINSHLRIADSMIDAGTTQEQFRACLDGHVFFWPTLRECLKMLDTYTRREPEGKFAVLEFEAYPLIAGHYSAVKLSKYDSGSSPRFPVHCSYRKSPAMFLPLSQFKSVTNHLVPVKTSEIKEILFEDRVMDVSEFLKAVYADYRENMPERWRALVKPLMMLHEDKR